MKSEVEEHWIFDKYTCKATNRFGQTDFVVELRQARQFQIFTNKNKNSYHFKRDKRTLVMMVGVANVTCVGLSCLK